MIDRFSRKFFDFLTEATPETTIQNFIDYLDPEFLGSTPIYRGDLFDRPADQIKFFDFVSAKSREGEDDVEKNIEECETIYEIFEFVEEPKKQFVARKVDRRIYKIHFSSESNNLLIMTSLLFIAAPAIKTIL